MTFFPSYFGSQRLTKGPTDEGIEFIFIVNNSEQTLFRQWNAVKLLINVFQWVKKSSERDVS